MENISLALSIYRRNDYYMTNIKENKNVARDKYIDLARAFAIICVVLCHSVESVYYTINWESLSTYSQFFKIFTFTIGRIGVPIFLCISGALLLRKNIENDEGVKKFYKKNLLPIFLTTEIWNIIYYVFLCIWKGNNFNFKILLETMLFMRNSEAPNMWYMPMILGIYIAIPFLAEIVKRFSLKTLSIPMIIVGMFTIIFPSLSTIIQDKSIASNVIDMSFLGSAYGLYVLLGYYISNSYKIQKISKRIIVLSIIITYFITVGIQIYLWNLGIKYNLWYNFLPLFLLGISIFCLFKKMEKIKLSEKFYKLIYTLSKYSFAIFFVHIIVRYLVRDYINSFNLINPIKVILTFIVLLIMSIIIIRILKIIPIIRKYVLFMKEEEKNGTN